VLSLLNKDMMMMIVECRNFKVLMLDSWYKCSTTVFRQEIVWCLEWMMPVGDHPRLGHCFEITFCCCCPGDRKVI